MTWTIVFANRPDFDAFVTKLPKDQRRVLASAINEDLQIYGPSICNRSLGKALGGSLYELRLRRSPNLLLRVFFGVNRGRVVIVGGYNKKSDSSKKRQSNEIRNARDVFDDWRTKDTSEKR
ncbi:MAG: hypothetical protein RLZ28_1051 [Actinomycetota bacterium]|jgi:hypothetical protein